MMQQSKEVTGVDQSGFVSGGETPNENPADDDENDAHYSASEEHKYFGISTAAIQRLGLMSIDAQNALRACQTKLRLQQQAGVQQTPIMGRFSSH